MNMHMLRVVKLNYKQGFQSSWHTHNYFHCIITLDGTGLVKVGDVEHHVKINDFILVPPRTYHMIATIENHAFKTIEAKFVISDEFFMNQVTELPVHMTAAGLWLRRLMEIIVREGLEKPVYYKYMIDNKLAEVFITLLRSQSTGSAGHADEKVVEDVNVINKSGPDMDAVLNYIQTNINENINVDDLSAVAMLSKSYFCTLFKERYGITPNQYIIRMKIDKAKEIMLYSDMNVSQIADYLGFASLHYFSKLFKKKEGIAPHEYMERMAENIEIDLDQHD